MVIHVTSVGPIVMVQAFVELRYVACSEGVYTHTREIKRVFEISGHNFNQRTHKLILLYQKYVKNRI